MRRQLGLGGAVFMGLGAMVGTGVFVSIGVAAGVAGPAVILAIGIAAGVALCNALSSAQLAAAHPVSGGTYEYGYRWLNPPMGFTAGWMFLCAKTASAATAAHGFAGYLLQMLPIEHSAVARIVIAVCSVCALTLIVGLGLHRANRLNMIIVTVALAALLTFVIAGLPSAARHARVNLLPFFDAGAAGGLRSAIAGLLEAAALMFVAFTGYGRIATMGEEVRAPRRTIPRAIIITVITAAMLYLAVGVVGVASSGATALSSAALQLAAPLEVSARAFDWPMAPLIVAAGAMVAMLGVLLNLILGLSRVLLAMGRRGDAPATLARLNISRTTPPVAVVVAGAAIAGLVLIGDVKTTWSFSAFGVLVYYAITNLATLRLPKHDAIYPRALAWVGLIACVTLAFWVTWRVALAGLLLIIVGLAWHAVAMQRLHRPSRQRGN